MTRLQRLLSTAVLAAMTFISAAACAHARLQNAVPAAGATLEAAPKEISLQFNEKLEAAFSSVKLTDSAGRNVAAAKSHLDPAKPSVLRLELPALKPGTYGVHWVVVGQDGHRLKGAYTFTIK
ncbi:MAG: copper homeostasis periplasmic binding protein CopC [Oxalobacteraceae bacterium]